LESPGYPLGEKSNYTQRLPYASGGKNRFLTATMQNRVNRVREVLYEKSIDARIMAKSERGFYC
jgi:hypothetical protein